MGASEVNTFLTYLAVKENVAASTQNQALCAIVFLYKHVLKQELGNLGDMVWAKKPKKLPVVLTQEEVKAVLAHLCGVNWIMAMLLYGSGLRLLECLRLRVQDVDFNYSQIVVREPKGNVDRVTMLSQGVKEPLRQHLEKVKRIHEADLKKGYGSVYLPYALERKYPHANRKWGWQYVFPASQLSVDPRSGIKRRHHLHETVLQRVIKEAIRKAGIVKHASCHT